MALGGLFSAIGKGVGAVGKGVGKANKYTLGKVGKHATNIANKVSGYEPDLKGPAPKVSTDVYGNTSLSTPKVVDPNSFKGRGGIKGGLKRVITGDPQAGKPGVKSTEDSPTSEVGVASAPKRPATGKLQAPLEYEPVDFNPNWRNWKSTPGKK